MKLTRNLFAAGLLLTACATVASASILPSSSLPALLFDDVPEPSSLVVLGCAVAGVLGLARHKSKR